MNRRMWITAAATGLTGALCLHLYLSGLEQELAGGAPQQVVVVTRDVALGETLTRGALALRDLPERYVEERHVLGAFRVDGVEALPPSLEQDADEVDQHMRVARGSCDGR